MFYLQSEKGVVEDTQGLVEAVVLEGRLHVIDVRINGNLYDAYGHPLLTDLDRGTGIAGCDGEIYFSEFTFVPTGGNMKLKPEHYLDDWGKLLRLP